MTFFNYGYYRTREAAEQAIEDMFADGEIDASDYPQVAFIKKGCWAVQLLDKLYAY